MMHSWLKYGVIFACLAGAARALAAEDAATQTLYLSGTGKDDPVAWDFICTAGQHANTWSTIGVPSNWELQGFGIYTYGTEKFPNGWPMVQGRYKRTFAAPAEWSGKTVHLVFDGVMTDTQVLINGQSAGPMHQGGYYRFKYDVTPLLKFGADNLIEVTVDDESANASINNAERRGDYWNYAGIFRPVYLEAVPQQSIARLAIAAQADGTLTVDAFVDGLNHLAGAMPVLEARVLDLEGHPVGEPFRQTTPFEGVTGRVRLATRINAPRLWTAETPNLYQLEVRQIQGADTTHVVRQRFGFRTIEARAGEGVFLNGQRIMFKGADRHSFWPDSGRTLSEKISRDDIALMKAMNMNAVRMSHYPPDAHFLDACDEMGMYVLDELPGWHQHYDTRTGHRLVEEMVTRDVNHPSIVFWDNGNEGGWNNDLNDDFATWDPQNRAVLHPWELFRGIDTKHYPDYRTLVQKATGPNPFFPTEMLHGLYDGGAGAGLEDYWNVMLKSKVSAGGFIWALLDESVKRVDQGGTLDSHGNQAPDGIVGPYREKEASFYTIRELWSPLVADNAFSDIMDFHGGVLTTYLPLENRFDFIDAKECHFTWEKLKFVRPNEQGAASVRLIQGMAQISGSIPPHNKGRLEVTTSGVVPDADIMRVHAETPDHHEIMTWSFPTAQLTHYRALATASAPGKVIVADQADTLQAIAGELRLTFDKKTGLLAVASRSGRPFSLTNGPRLVTGNATLASLEFATEDADAVITATYTGDLKSITYRLHPNGWVGIEYAYALAGPHDFFGVGFDYPEARLKSMRYLGDGPFPVYKNRLAGGTLDVWEKKYNDTAVGDPDPSSPGVPFDYPPFKGYYAGVRWLQLQTTEGPVTVLLNQDDLFVQVLTPRVPPANQLGQTGVAYPHAGLSFLHAIPAIGSKFNRPNTGGPQGQPTDAHGAYKGSISLYFGELP